jgi:cephalosporin hydroxylase
MKIEATAILINRDLCEWPKKMCERIMQFDGIKKIIIIDNGSTSRKTLEWYKSNNYQVKFIENIGHTSPWSIGILDEIETDYYIVSDPDLDLDSVPIDCVQVLGNILEKNPYYLKVGLGLIVDDIPVDSPYFNHVNTYEKALSNLPVIDNQFTEAPVDTTFAIYNKNFLKEYKICGVRTTYPYVAKHLPWYEENPTGEFKFYLDHASSKFSSYLNFTENLKQNGEIKLNSKTLKNLYAEHTTGKVSTKWDSYFDIYEENLSYRRDKVKGMLEIGIQNGGSLDIWVEYFDKIEIIIGNDINENCAKLKYEDPRVNVIIGNACDLTTFNAIKGKLNSNLDLIIDDGSHTSNDTITNFINYYPLLNAGGIYIIEDMHCAYWPEYGGGFYNERSASSFFKKISDVINIEHSREANTVNKIFETFFNSGSTIPTCLTDQSIYSVSFYNSIYVIRKANTKLMPLLGKEILSGEVALVDNRVLKIRE